MRQTSFYRPMFLGFAITAAAMLLLPADAQAQATSDEQCEAPPAKSHGLRLGRLLSAVHGSPAAQMLAGAGQHGMFAATIASTALQAASRVASETTDRSAAPNCDTAKQ